METLNYKKTFSDNDRADLLTAVTILEKESFVMKAMSLIGKPIDLTMEKLPFGAKKIVEKAVYKALEKALDITLLTLDKEDSGVPANNNGHKLLAAAAGGGGGFFGFLALPIELPISTAIMLRSIADIARSEGEDLNDLEARMSCLEVFSLEGGKKGDDDADIAYYAARAAMAQITKEAAAILAGRGGHKFIASQFTKIIEIIASRFGAVVSQKAIVQSIPLIGAVSGAAINLAFIDYYQDMARAHFTIRRLERIYGSEFIREEYVETKMAYSRSEDIKALE